LELAPVLRIAPFFVLYFAKKNPKIFSADFFEQLSTSKQIKKYFFARECNNDQNASRVRADAGRFYQQIFFEWYGEKESCKEKKDHQEEGEENHKEAPINSSGRAQLPEQGSCSFIMFGFGVNYAADPVQNPLVAKRSYLR
jgi:hypothetical protein